MNAPCVYREIGPSAVSASSTLYGSVLAPEALHRLLPADLLAREGAPFSDLAADLRLQRREIVLAHGLGELEVVVEAAVDRRADRDLDAGVQSHGRLREEVRRGVAKHRERVRILGVAGGQDLQPLAVGERQTQVARLAVGSHEHRLLGQLRPDRARSVEPGRAVGQLELESSGRMHLHRPTRIAMLTTGNPLIGWRGKRYPMCR